LIDIKRERCLRNKASSGGKRDAMFVCREGKNVTEVLYMLYEGEKQDFKIIGEGDSGRR
jgi:hypothetical protein